MTVSVNLTGGGSVLVWQTLGGVSFQTFDANLLPLGSPTTVMDGSTVWLSAAPLADGGFSVVWDSSASSLPTAQNYDATGMAVGSTYSIATPPIAETAFTTLANTLTPSDGDPASTIVLPDGGYTTAFYSPGTSQHVQQYDSSSNPVGPAFVNSQLFGFGNTQLTVLADGNYAVSTVLPANYSALSTVDLYSPGAAHPLDVVVDQIGFNGDFSFFPQIYTQSVAGLPDGGFVVSWTAQNDAPAEVYSQEFTAAGTAAGPVHVLGAPGPSPTPISAPFEAPYAPAEIDVFSNGQYVISWTSPTGVQHNTFTETGSPIAPGNNNQIDTPDPTYTLPIGPHDLTLSGTAAQTVTGNSLGDIITSNDYGSTIIGGSGNDTLIAGHGADVLTGGGGDNIFEFNYLPWSAGQITDFQVGTDTLDLNALLSAAGYTGSDAVADGYVIFNSDGSGDTQVYFNAHSSSDPWPTLITTLDHIAPTGLTAANVLGEAGSSSSSPPPPPPPTVVDDAAATYTLPSNVQDVRLTGTAAQTVTGNSLGDIITSNDYGSTIIGGSGNDTLIAGHGADMLTGGGGSNVFEFNYLPWNAGQIADFHVGTDKLDLSALLSAAGYTGSDPVADGYVTFASDGSGDTQVYLNTHNPADPWPTLITTLDGVAPSGLTAANVLGESGAPSPSSPPPPPTVVDDSAATYTLPSNVRDVVLTGTVAQIVTGNSLGDVITSNDYGSTILGGSGNDTLIAGHGADTLTGGGGNDTFDFKYLPWNAGHITDFNPASDVLDLRALFSAAGYTGSNPVADGYLTFSSDGAGDAQVYLNTHNPSAPWPFLITTLDHVAPTALHAGDYLFA
jgi:Ca2+-binding RTX toxin-like protein